MAIAVFSVAFVDTITVSAAGTSKAIHSTLRASQVWLTPDSANTGLIYIGDSTVSAARYLRVMSATDDPFIIGSPDPIEILALSGIFVDSSGNNNKVHVSRKAKSN